MQRKDFLFLVRLLSSKRGINLNETRLLLFGNHKTNTQVQIMIDIVVMERVN